MGPEITTAMALVAMVEKMGGWGVGSFLLVFFMVPPVLAYLGIRLIVKALNALREQIASSEANTKVVLAEFSQRYDNNVELVTNYERTAEALLETIRRSTMVSTKLVDRIDTMREGK
ncbi:MAG TPA: hypothetical protein ENJ30_02000 [Desulfobulbaceae bacterium]|nr:hypothetical protein [Desulfobulbaceae bacterium]